MSDAQIAAAQQEACEAQADVLEQHWEADRRAREFAETLPADAPADIGATATSQAGWQAGGDKEAAWAMDLIARATAERDRIRRNAQEAIEQIQAKALRDEARSTHTIDFFTGKLITYRRTLEEHNPKLPKTYPLPNGDLCVRAGRTSVKVIDEGALVDWLLEHRPSGVTYKPKVTALKDLPRSGELIVDEDGAPVPGVVEVTAEPTYSVKPTAPEPEPF